MHTRTESLQARLTLRRIWRQALRAGARQDLRTRFPSPPVGLLARRLRHASKRLGFSVGHLRVLRPRQLAPLIVVRTRHKLALARQVPALVRAIDPYRKLAGRDAEAYEGLYLEADDPAGVPFLIVWNAWRGRSPVGGQWAQRESFFPYGHG